MSVPKKDIIETSDGKKWFYDYKHHNWVDVSVDNPKLKKLIKESVRVR